MLLFIGGLDTCLLARQNHHREACFDIFVEPILLDKKF